jgi:hypothetical protein
MNDLKNFYIQMISVNYFFPSGALIVAHHPSKLKTWYNYGRQVSRSNGIIDCLGDPDGVKRESL